GSLGTKPLDKILVRIGLVERHEADALEVHQLVVTPHHGGPGRWRGPIANGDGAFRRGEGFAGAWGALEDQVARRHPTSRRSGGCGLVRRDRGVGFVVNLGEHLETERPELARDSVLATRELARLQRASSWILLADRDAGDGFRLVELSRSAQVVAARAA